MLAFALVAALALILADGRAHALAPPTPWDGVNPFRCTIQDAGQGTAVPDPGADPYCVRFDKSNQNVTQLGLITFLTEEPARFSAAAPKCFYYQEDHWRGSVVQANQQTVVYEFYGHYFFNKATGDGGAWVTGFKLAGQTFDPRSLPGFPPQYDQYYGPGTGGVITHNDIPTDPNCAAKANSSPSSVYAASPPHCLRAQGSATRRGLGPARLGASASRLRKRLGEPGSTSRGIMSWCLASGGNLFIATRRPAGSRGRPTALMITATGPGFSALGERRQRVGVGTGMRRLRRAFPSSRRAFRVGQVTYYALTAAQDADDPTRSASGAVLAGVANGRVTELAAYNPRRLSGRTLARYLARMR